MVYRCGVAGDSLYSSCTTGLHLSFLSLFELSYALRCILEVLYRLPGIILRGLALSFHKVIKGILNLSGIHNFLYLPFLVIF